MWTSHQLCFLCEIMPHRLLNPIFSQQTRRRMSKITYSRLNNILRLNCMSMTNNSELPTNAILYALFHYAPAMCRTNRLEGFIARPRLPGFISWPVYPVRMLHCHGNHLFTENRLRRRWIRYTLSIAGKPTSHINRKIYLSRSNQSLILVCLPKFCQYKRCTLCWIEQYISDKRRWPNINKFRHRNNVRIQYSHIYSNSSKGKHFKKKL